MKNIIRVYRELFRHYPSMKWQMTLRAVLVVAIPLIESAIPAMAIAMIMEKDIGRYMTGISLLLLVDVGIRIGENFLANRSEDYSVGTRVMGFWVSLLKKNLTMDYCHTEPAKKQTKMQKGMNALNGDSLGVQGLIDNTFGLVCYSVGLLSYGAIIVTVDIRVLLIMAGMSVTSFFLHRHAVHYSDRTTKDRDHIGRLLWHMTWEARESEYGKDVRMYHIENWFEPLFLHYQKKLLRWYGQTEIRWYFPTLSDTIFAVARDVLMYSILIMNVIQGRMTVAEFTFYVGIVAGFSSWLSTFLFRLSGVMKTNLETKALYDVFEEKDVFLHGEGDELDVTAPVSIEFRDVSFGYEEGEEIISHLSFRIERGQKIALVGNNGAGKTTIVKLLCGFYLPTGGEVLINGIPTSRYNIEKYRQGISAVFQDGFISALTVAENIAGGEENMDKKRVRECLKQAGLWGKISALPDKEDSYISQALEKSGVDFSGGERQKLLIARALYKNGRLLILDEPTSALDPLAESNIYQAYNEMTGDKTAIFISHRLASTKFCDEILFLEKGKVIERGSHEELLKNQGSYAKMFEIQSHYYKEEVAGK